jgi:hypothetical protein
MKKILRKKNVTIIIGVLLSLFLVQGANAGLNFIFEIPTRTITIDGLPGDWAGIKPVLVDPQGDSTCGTGTDIKSVFVAQDSEYLYWRIDTWSGAFLFSEEWMGPGISIMQNRDTLSPGDIEMGIHDNSYGMNGWISQIDVPNPPILLYSGPEYGWGNSVAEGKIPLSVFSGADFNDMYGKYSGVPAELCDNMIDDQIANI